VKTERRVDPMRQMDRTGRFVVVGAGLGAAFSASAEFLAHALGIRSSYLLAAVIAWYVLLIVVFVRHKRAVRC
jgi:putative flippase GtrA